MSSEFERVVDPDVDLHDPVQVAETGLRQWDVLAAIAFGGLLGAEARYALASALPHTGAEFPWATVIINASGSALIGILMVVILQLTTPHRLARPFLGVGLLGGYTTFSTFSVDTVQLVVGHHAATAVGYLVLTLLACAAAVWTATVLTQFAGRGRIEQRR